LLAGKRRNSQSADKNFRKRFIQPRNERKDIVNTLSALIVNEAPRASFRHALKPMAAVKTQEINFLDQAPANWYRVGTVKLM
jgi:hypothetical protein